MKQHNRRLDIVLALALAAFVLLPWYRIEDGFLSFGWLAGMFGDGATAPGLWQVALFGRPWLGAVAVFMLLCAGARLLLPVERRSGVLIWA
ncbi:MAG TPA: iron ABC transporter permease, partial [Ochrobactrum anthropi]|nr:iron ABC transporter permease [Brucella anthropi]